MYNPPVAYAQHNSKLRHIYGAFCKAYCMVYPLDAIKCLSSILNEFPKWIEDSKLIKVSDAEELTVKASIPDIINAIMFAFESSQNYRGLRKQFNVTYRSLSELEKFFADELKNQYESSTVAVRGGLGNTVLGDGIKKPL